VRGRGGWLAAVLLFIAVLLLPGAPRSPFAGAPLAAAGYALLACGVGLLGLGVLFAPARRVPASALAVLALLAVLKPVAADLSGPAGWRGVYYAEPDPAPRPFKAGALTRDHRVDAAIDFEGPRFDLPFINDIRYRTPISPQRRDRKLPVRVEWTGHAWLEQRATVRLQVASRGGVSVSVDGAEVMNVVSPRPFSTAELLLDRGLHRIAVAYAKPAMTSPLVRLALTADGRELPVAPTPGAARGLARQPWFGAATTAGVVLAALLAAGLAAWCFPPRLLLASPARASAALVFGLVLLVGTVQRVLPVVGRTVSLSAGDDYLSYEAFARDILFNGLLMPSGAAPGQGAPYYHYPLYPYALAAVHAVLGETFSAVIFFNVVAVGSVGILCWFLAWRHLRGWSATAGVLAIGVFTWYHLLPYTRTSFSDNLFVALVFVALLLCERALATQRRAWWIAAGAAAAAAAATRPSFLTHAAIWPAAVLLFGLGSPRRRVAQIACFWAGVLAGLAPFAARNWIMSRRLVLLVNSWIQIPYFLYPWWEPKPIPPLRSLSEALQQAWLFALARPWTVVDMEARKVAFTLGLTEVGPAHVGSHPLLLAGFALFVAALLLRRMPRPLAVVLGSFAVSHLAAMVVAAPWTYGYKTILPLHAAFLVGGVHVLSRRPALESGAEAAAQGRG